MGKLTEYFERARQCADIAERMTGADKDTLLEIADVWLRLAAAEAKAAISRSSVGPGAKALDQDRLTKSIRRKPEPEP
jgi:hypothetical protein